MKRRYSADSNKIPYYAKDLFKCNLH